MELTPKEKARKLVESFYDTEHCGIKHFPNDNFCECVEMNFYQAKQCALICLDEMENILMNGEDCSFENASKVMYLEEVKKEIEKL
jgi:hypothetical protein